MSNKLTRKEIAKALKVNLEDVAIRTGLRTTHILVNGDSLCGKDKSSHIPEFKDIKWDTHFESLANTRLSNCKSCVNKVTKKLNNN